MIKHLMNAIFGEDPPAAPTPGTTYARSGVEPEWYRNWNANHPAKKPRGKPLPPAPRPYHAAVPSGAPQAPAVAFDPRVLAGVASTASTVASDVSNIMSALASTSPTATASVSMGGEMTIRHNPDGSIHIEHQPHGDMGCEGDVDFVSQMESTFDGTAGSKVDYHPSRTDAFGPTHDPYDFGDDEHGCDSGITG